MITIGVTKKSGPSALEMLTKLRKLRGSDVLVGIPTDKVQRSGDKINNASLAFIHENGSSLAHIPARPFLKPGIENARQLIAKQLAAAGQAVLEGNPAGATQFLNKAGQVGVNSVKRMFDNNTWPANAPSTIKQKGSDRPLIDTGQMKRAISYVVRENNTTISGESSKEEVIAKTPTKIGAVEEVEEAAESVL